MSTLDRIILLIDLSGLSNAEVAAQLNLNVQVITDWKSGKSHSYKKYIYQLANILNTTVEYLTGKTDIKEKPSKETGVKANAVFLNDEKICMIPVFESVSAGFGTQANDCIIEYMPCYIPNPAEINDYMCIKVTGDSMFPKIENGDIIQVHRQTSVDSGSIAVVLIDGEDGVVKRVEYGNDWIELHSINPMYPVRRFEGADVLRLRVVGLVKKIIKDV